MFFGFELPEPFAQRSFEHGILALGAAGAAALCAASGASASWSRGGSLAVLPSITSITDSSTVVPVVGSFRTVVLVPPGVPVDAATANDAREPTEGAEQEQ